MATRGSWSLHAIQISCHSAERRWIWDMLYCSKPASRTNWSKVLSFLRSLIHHRRADVTTRSQCQMWFLMRVLCSSCFTRSHSSGHKVLFSEFFHAVLIVNPKTCRSIQCPPQLRSLCLLPDAGRAIPQLASLIQQVLPPPATLGGRSSNAAHRLSAFLHSLHLITGDFVSLRRLLSHEHRH